MGIPPILNLEKSRNEREIKEFQKEADKVAEVVWNQIQLYKWNVLKTEKFINAILPGLLGMMIENSKIGQSFESLISEPKK